MKGFLFRFILVFAAVFAVLFLFVFFYLSVATSTADAAEAEGDFPKIAVEIISQDGARHKFRAEFAQTPALARLGLMYRKTLDADAGMLFRFDPPRPGSMWMKNTYVSLDMLFADASQTFVHFAENTTPLSEEIITTPMPVAYVLEVPAGTAKRLGLALGDRMQIHEVQAQLPTLSVSADLCEAKRWSGK